MKTVVNKTGTTISLRAWILMFKRLIYITAIVCSVFVYLPYVDFSLAQNMTIETIPPEVDESGNTTEERIDQIVVTIRILAGVVLAGTVGYWWHTRPKKSVIRKKVIEVDQDATKDSEVDSMVSDSYEDFKENN